MLILTLAGSASAQTEMVRLTRFEGQEIKGLRVLDSFDVELVYSDETYAVVEVPKDYEERLIFDIDDKGIIRLGIRSFSGVVGPGEKNTRKTNKNTGGFKTKVYLNDLEYLHSYGMSNIHAKGTFEVRFMDIRLAGSSTISNLAIDSETLINIVCEDKAKVNASFTSKSLVFEGYDASRAYLNIDTGTSRFDLWGSAGIELRGSIDDLFINAWNGSFYKGTSVTNNTATAELRGFSKVFIGETNFLTLRRYSSGVVFRGTPRNSDLQNRSSATAYRNFSN